MKINENSRTQNLQASVQQTEVNNQPDHTLKENTSKVSKTVNFPGQKVAAETSSLSNLNANTSINPSSIGVSSLRKPAIIQN